MMGTLSVPFDLIAWAVGWTLFVAVGCLCIGYLMGRQTKTGEAIMEPVRRAIEAPDSTDDPGGDIFREAMGEED